MSKVACALHINFEPGCWECDDANPSTEAEPERICGRAEASCHADRDAMTSELAEARRLADEWCRAWAELPSPEATDELRRELAEARRQLGEADEKLLAIAGIVNGYHNDTAEAASWDCLRAIATVCDLMPKAPSTAPDIDALASETAKLRAVAEAAAAVQRGRHQDGLNDGPITARLTDALDAALPSWRTK